MNMPFLHLAKLPVFAASALLLPLCTLSAQTTGSAQTAAPLTQAQIFQQLDPQMAVVVKLWDVIKGTPITQLSPQKARQQFAPQDAVKIIARASGKAEEPMSVMKVQDGLTIPGSDGNQIPIRIYTPQGKGPFPVVLYFHGGGFVIATIDTYDASARAIADYSRAIVVSVEYRKAPEAPFPAALDDAIASYKWVINNMSRYNGIETKVALAGESAGGNLAAEVAIAARDERLQQPTHQLLIYPETTSNLNQPSDLMYTDSSLPLTRGALVYLDNLYLSNPSEAGTPRVAPLNNDLHKLAPATIIAAQIDPLVSDGMDYANKLHAAGNPVAYQLYTGVTHEFFGMGAVVDKAKAAEEFGGARLAASFR
jgi:acetyl esterase